jgi:hypothetical protein
MYYSYVKEVSQPCGDERGITTYFDVPICSSMHRQYTYDIWVPHNDTWKTLRKIALGQRNVNPTPYNDMSPLVTLVKVGFRGLHLTVIGLWQCGRERIKKTSTDDVVAAEATICFKRLPWQEDLRELCPKVRWDFDHRRNKNRYQISICNKFRWLKICTKIVQSANQPLTLIRHNTNDDKYQW